MNKATRRLLLSELTIWLVAAGMLIYFLLPLRKKIRLGLDLAGGTFVTLSVQTDKAVEAELVDHLQNIVKELKKSKNIVPQQKIIEQGIVICRFGSYDEARAAATIINQESRDLEYIVDKETVKFHLKDSAATKIKREAVERNVEVLRIRLDAIGVSETPVTMQGDNRIVIELPDVKDPEQAKAMIGKTAQLEFRLVDAEGSENDILDRFDGELPYDKELLPTKRSGTFVLVSRYAEINGKHLKDARPVVGGELGNEPMVAFVLTKEGGERMHELTSKNIGRKLAIVLDNVVINYPTIQSAIRSEGSITGGFRLDEAKELALLLKSGAFVAPVVFEEERQIGPSLGMESIKQGFFACAVALALILIFCLIFYSLSGLIAFITLIYNLLLTLYGLSQLGATLTLPGIAGMVLTVGMAVDASILIFERMRESLAHGDRPREAVDKGFSDALQVILDANITTFLVGAVLYFFETGPIQGFAVTMMLGIVATLITGLFFQRALFKFVLDNFTIQKLRI